MNTTVESWNFWKDWNNSANDNSAVIAMQFLKKLCEAYQVELSKAKEQYENKKKALYSQNHDNLATIGNKESVERERITADSNAELYCIDTNKKESHDKFHADLNNYLRHNETEGGLRGLVVKLLASTFADLETAAQTALAQEASAQETLRKAFEAQRNAADELGAALLKKNEAAAELERAKESDRYNEELSKLQQEFKDETDGLERKFKALICEIASNKDLGEYINLVRSSVPSAENYACSPLIPDIVYLGDVSMEIAKKSAVHPEVAQLLTSEVSKVFPKQTTDVLTATLPYCQRLDDGISLFVNYSTADRAEYQEHLKTLLLKLFMAFPAGKLEATMIDPLELGETFSLFTKLGEEQSRIIDTKIWSQEKDITESINILRQKLETMTQSYGNDKETRLKKEPVRVLAITDFPTGFTQNALRDLQAIVRKSASYGVCVLIWANSAEVAKLQQSQQSIFNEIKHMLHVATVKNNSMVLETSKYPGVVLKLDPMEEAKEKSAAVINTLVKGIHSSQKKKEYFIDMFDGIEDPNNWFGEDTIDEMSIPIGIKGANTVVKMIVGRTDGSTAHHALIAGQTGAGKSTLLHTIIMSTLLQFSPDEAQLYLVDFKEGVEFKTYSKLNLPSIRVVAIDCEREFGLNILKELQKEMKRRYDVFKREADREDISDYRKVRGVKMPKLLVVFDEVQELFRGASDDPISKECENLLSELLTLGRAAGIHIVLASQNFDLIPSIKQTLFSHAAIRIAINGSEDSAQSVLGANNAGAKQFKNGDVGAAVYNDASGKESANVIFQVAYLEKPERAKYLNTLSSLQNSEAFARKYKGKTRILLTSAEDDIFNAFNQFIINKKIALQSSDKDSYSMVIGDGFEIKRKFNFELSPISKDNLLIIGNDEKRAAGIFYFSILSLLYSELCTDSRKDNQLIHLIDLSVEDEYAEEDNTNFRHLEACFKNQVMRANMRRMPELLASTHESLMRRMDGLESTDERLFLLFFGINRAHKLMATAATGENMYAATSRGDEEKMDNRSKLADIMRHGPKYGINCIFWGENLPATCRIIGNNIDRDFAQRIAFATDNVTFEQLVMEQNGQLLRPTTAVYMNVEEDVKNTHFRPYEIPAKVWVEKFAKTYREFE